MLTILTSPKPFVGIDKTNQYRAINSWKKIKNVEIFLYGDEFGIENASNDLNVQVVKNVDLSDEGMPYFNSIIHHANNVGKYNIQMYINCDILMNSTILLALELIKFNKFLLIGERIDLDEGVYIDINKNGYKNELVNNYNKSKVKFHGPTGIDYFIFTKGIWESLPKIIVGRGGYDSALLAHCKRNLIPVIDGTETIIALHQFHNYSHVTGGKKTVFFGSDAKVNNKAQGSKYSGNWVSDSDYAIKNNELVSWVCRGNKLRAFELYIRFNLNFEFGALFIRMLNKLFNGKHSIPPSLNGTIIDKLNE